MGLQIENLLKLIFGVVRIEIRALDHVEPFQVVLGARTRFQDLVEILQFWK